MAFVGGEGIICKIFWVHHDGDDPNKKTQYLDCISQHSKQVIKQLIPKQSWVVVSNIFYLHPYVTKRSNLTTVTFSDGLKPPIRKHPCSSKCVTPSLVSKDMNVTLRALLDTIHLARQEKLRHGKSCVTKRLTIWTCYICCLGTNNSSALIFVILKRCCYCRCCCKSVRICKKWLGSRVVIVFITQYIHSSPLA